ncbi:MAG: DUF4915 domain-containing protein [Puniceicoccaceae bacterium]
MYIVSFVNQILSPNLRLGLFDKEFKSFNYLDANLEIDASGATGIDFAIDQRLIYVAFQSSHICVFDHRFALVQRFHHSSIKDPHSILISNNHLFVVSTGNDSVFIIPLDDNGLLCGEPLREWTYPESDGTVDSIHVNSIINYHGRKLVSLFGSKVEEVGNENPNSGKVVTLDNKVIISGLKNPHSLFLINDRLCVLNSSEGEILDDTRGVLYKSKGYFRGVHCTGDKLLVGINKRRLLSKHRNHTIRGRIEDFESEIDHSAIEIIDTHSWKRIDRIPFELYGREIYEIREVPFELEIAESTETAELQRLNGIENQFIQTIRKIDTRYSEESKVATEKFRKSEREVASLSQTIEELKSELDRVRKSEEEFKKRFSVLSQINLENEDQLVSRTQKLKSSQIRAAALEEALDIAERQLIDTQFELENIRRSRLWRIRNCAVGVLKAAKIV